MTNPLLSLAATSARLLPGPLKRALYRLGPVSRLIRSGLNRAAPEGLTEIAVAGGGLQGFRMLLDLQEEKDYWLGTYEVELQDAIWELVRPGWVAYDLGANIGYITLLLARTVGETGGVHTFEALPANVERLRANLALNGLEERVRVVQAAVCDRDGTTEFLVHASRGMGKAAGSAGRDESYPERFTVQGISFDSYVYAQQNSPPQAVKIDIEGGEALALPGMKRVLKEARPLLFLELHGEEAARTSWEILTGHGYRLHSLQRGYPPVPTLESLDWKAYLIARPEESI